MCVLAGPDGKYTDIGDFFPSIFAPNRTPMYLPPNALKISRFRGFMHIFQAAVLANGRNPGQPRLPAELWEHVFGFIYAPSRLAVAGVGLAIYYFCENICGMFRNP